MGATITTGMLSTTINGISVNSSIATSSGNYNTCTSRTVNYIVMHYTGNSKDTAKANATYFQTSGRNASAHFFVDDSNIYQGVKLKDYAWHCGATSYKHASCRNNNSFGIEMCCTAGNYKISSTTITNAAYLCAYLCNLLGITSSQVDTYVLRHYDVTGKECPAQMAGSSNSEWTNFKTQVKNILSGSSSSSSTSSTTSTSTSTSTSSSTSTSYKVKVTASALNIRKGPGTSYAITGTITDQGVYTIVEESNNWGKLKSGLGWISLSYTKKV